MSKPSIPPPEPAGAGALAPGHTPGPAHAPAVSTVGWVPGESPRPGFVVLSCRSLAAPEFALWLSTVEESSPLVWLVAPEAPGDSRLGSELRSIRLLRDGSSPLAGDVWILPPGERAAWVNGQFRWQLPLRGTDTASPLNQLVQSLAEDNEIAPHLVTVELTPECALVRKGLREERIPLDQLSHELANAPAAISPSPAHEDLESLWALVDLEGRVLSAAPNVCNLTRITENEQRLHADLDAPLRSAIQALVTGGVPVHVRQRPLLIGQRTAHVGFVLSTSRAADPSATSDFLVSFHCSEAWVGESSASDQAHSRDLESFYDSAPIGLAALDSQFRFLRINKRLAEMNGLPVREHIGKTLREVMGDAAIAVEETMRPVLKRGVSVRDLEVRGRTNVDKTLRDWLLQYTPISGDCGTITGINVVVQDITAQKEASRRLAAEHEITHLLADENSSEALFPEILETLCDALEIQMGEIWLYDEGSRSIQPSHSFSTSDDLAARAFRDAVPTDPLQQEGCPAVRAWLSGDTEIFRAVDTDTKFPRHALAGACGLDVVMAFPLLGEEHPYGSIALFAERPFDDESALRDSLETIGQDIGRFIRRERIEFALRASEEELRTITDSIPMKISLVDQEGKYRFTNEEYVRSFGLSKEELQGLHVRDLIGEEAYTQVKPMMRRALAGGEVEYEVDLPSESGPASTVAVKYKPRREADGSISGFYALVVDVTQRANAERESTHKANCLEAIRRVNLELTGELDLSRLERSVTEAAVKISGAEAGAFVHKITDESRLRAAVYSSVATPPSREIRSSHADYALKGPTRGATETVRVRDLREDPESAGALRLFAFPVDTPPIRSYLAAPVMDRHGELVGSIMLTHSSVDAFDSNAEEIVGGIALQVGIALENASLYETLRAREQSSRFQARQLEIMDRQKDEFLAILGHELRNPLMALGTGICVLREDNIDAEELSWTHQMLERQTAQLTSLVDDLLDATRISRGKVRLRKKSVDLTEVIEACVSTVDSLAQAKKQAIQVDLANSETRVHGDRVRLEQVVTNLLTNAVKYSGQGTTIQIALDQLSPSRVCLSVADKGMGLPQESLERIFEPFTQRDVASEGLGIGLSLVRQLVALHGGRTYAESPGPGEGSTFFIELPTEAYAEREAASEPETANEVSAPVSDTDVLLINGSGKPNGEIAGNLRNHGCRVIAAQEHDIEGIAEDLRPQIVLIDLEGIVDEIDLVANRVRNLPSCYGTTVIALRDPLTQNGPQRALDRIAFDEIWTLPVPEESIAEAVDRCVSQRARSHRSETLLLVEDNKDSARAMCLLLREDEGLRVVSAGTIADALLSFEKYRPQIVLSDIGLPDGSGYDLAKTLRSHGDSRLTLIAISGHAGELDRRRSLDAGFDEHLPKPVDFDKLRALLKNRPH